MSEEGRAVGVNGRVTVLDEVQAKPENHEWTLCFQRCRYVYTDGKKEEGYRFIWRRPDGSLQGARGQARLPSMKIARELMEEAEKAGWGHYETDPETLLFRPARAAK
ncbi:hypothetical protein [Myxococcus sp. Y35]|uniref:hypothetical protein n=1 Tax=Pseudomyxococcus flavus TaxID=3115648 RepID=UPI003CF2B1F2